jgi:ribonuclease J
MASLTMLMLYHRLCHRLTQGRDWVRLLILDGAETIGGTKLYLESRHDAVLLDFGLNYRQWGLYFEEYLQPRAGRGLHDLFKLQLAPPYSGLYRNDLFPQNYKPKYQGHLEPKACLLSHAHLDHCGVVGLLRGDLSIYASPLSAAIMKTMQDTAQASFYGEMAYTVPRVVSENDPRAVEASSYRTVAAQQRPWRLFGASVTQNLRDLLSSPPNPSPKARPFITAPIELTGERIGELRLKVWPVDHSIPGASACAFETDAGWIVYTGDIRLHGRAGDQTERFLQEASQLSPELLIIEGTRVPERAQAVTTEQDVYEEALAVVQNASGQLVIADFGPRNIERLMTFLQIARETRRRLLILPKDAYLLKALAAADANFNVLNHTNLAIFHDVKLEVKAWEERVRQDYKAKLISIEEVHRDPGAFVLAFSFWDLKHLLDIEPSEGVYIYSTSEAHSEEQELDIRRLFNWLRFFRLKPVGIELGPDGRSQTVGNFHASGHASADDLLHIVRTIRPKRLLPVHTEHPEFFAKELKGDLDVLIVKNGASVTL